ncbi:hypothetical protein BJV74DRAFT_865484, partial [Russula compacta]
MTHLAAAAKTARPRILARSRNPLDINSFLPLHETTPGSDCVKLTPSILSLHAKEYAEQATAHSELIHHFV